MNHEPFHLEQYKMLREEMMFHMRQISHTEMSGSIAVASLYAWLLLPTHVHVSRIIWFVAPGVVLFCGLRCLVHTVQINFIGAYLGRIEDSIIGKDAKLPGWESYLKASAHRLNHRMTLLVPAIGAGVAWTLALASSILLSWYLSK